jgi:hypothetical protein
MKVIKRWFIISKAYGEEKEKLIELSKKYLNA